MLSFIKMSVTMLKVLVLSVVLLNVIMLNVVILNVTKISKLYDLYSVSTKLTRLAEKRIRRPLANCDYISYEVMKKSLAVSCDRRTGKN
jgi:hypothetical protein